MRWLYAIRARLLALASRRSRLDDQLNADLDFHLEQETLDRVRRGMTPDEARRTARADFGSLQGTRESVRDLQRTPVLDTTWRNLKYAARSLRKRPGFTGAVVVSLAIAIGANTAIFSLLYDVLLAPLPLPHPNQLVSLESVDAEGRNRRFTHGEFASMRDRSDVVRLAFTQGEDNVAVAVDRARTYINIDVVDASFFEILGLQPIAGRFINSDDDRLAANVVVVSELFYERQLHRDPTWIGKRLNLGGAPFTVIGVTPRAFRGIEYPGMFAIAVPLSAARATGLVATTEASRTLEVFGRLSEGASPSAGTSALDAIYQRCCLEAGHTRRLQLFDMSHGVGGGKDDARDDLRGWLAALMAVVALVLVIACANVANLLMMRGADRSREIALRLSIGASRARVSGELLTESVLLVALAAVVGYGLAAAGRAWLATAIPVNFLAMQEVFHFRPQWSSAFFTAGLATVCVLMTAILPTLRASRLDLIAAMQSTRGASQPAADRLMRAAVVVQIALALVVVVSAGLLGGTMMRLTAEPTGLAADRVALAAVETRGTTYEPTGIGPLHLAIESAIRSMPEVEDVGLATFVPFFGGRHSTATIEFDVARSGTIDDVLIDSVTPKFFSAAGIALVNGRAFDDRDSDSAPKVVILNEALVRQLRGDSHDIIGHAVRLGNAHLDAATVVGVVKDTRLLSLRDAPPPAIYMPVKQTSLRPFLEVIARTRALPAGFAERLSGVIDQAAPGVRVRRVSMLGTEIRDSLSRERLAAILVAFFAAIALGLASLGLYGAMSNHVARRTPEFGIRAALGARRVDIGRAAARSSIALVAIGLAVGLPLALLAGRALSPQLFGITASDLGLYAASIAAVIGIASIAVAIPARRAATIDPLIALQDR